MMIDGKLIPKNTLIEKPHIPMSTNNNFPDNIVNKFRDFRRTGLL